ncbi:hypothetical protein HID58_034035 [Brassica napus]|uniref:DUF287 domain-containing protein n=1 Tax=Brassica napus TaxID=3708 RepID=A0ABQ8C0X2_BRANA|nr:hypothetical protein HID58_034035 [Brassica napus]
MLDLDGNEAPEAIKPTIMFFKPSETRNGTMDIDSIIPTRTPQEKRLLDDILEDEDDVDESDIAVESWEKCLTARRGFDKKVDQLDGRLTPLEEFVKEAQAKAAEEEAPAQEKAKKHKRKKK